MYIFLFLQVSKVDTQFLLTEHFFMIKGVNLAGKRHAYQFGLYQIGPFVPLPGDDPTIREKYSKYICSAISIYIATYIYAAT